MTSGRGAGRWKTVTSAGVLLSLLGACATGESSSPAPTRSPEVNPLDRYALARLSELGNPGLEELGYDDSKVRVTVKGDEILVVIHGRALRVTPPARAEATGPPGAQVRSEAFGAVWRFGCTLREFGDRVIDVAFAAEPRLRAAEVHRALGCGP